MKPLSLGKSHRLCSLAAIDRLFAERGNCVGAWPLRAVWLADDKRQRGERVQILVSIPKRRLHRAVDRVAMRRKVREAYRLNRFRLNLPAEGLPIDLAFIYTADTPVDYRHVERAMIKLLQRLSSLLSADNVEAPSAIDSSIGAHDR